MPGLGIPALEISPTSGRRYVCQKACTWVKVQASSLLNSMSSNQIRRNTIPAATAKKLPIPHSCINGKKFSLVISVGDEGRKCQNLDKPSPTAGGNQRCTAINAKEQMRIPSQASQRAP